MEKKLTGKEGIEVLSSIHGAESYHLTLFQPLSFKMLVKAFHQESWLGTLETKFQYHCKSVDTSAADTFVRNL